MNRPIEAGTGGEDKSPRQPDPELVELLMSGSLIPIARAYGKDESSPDVDVIAVYDPSPENTGLIRELVTVSIPMEDLRTAIDAIRLEEVVDFVLNRLDRLWRGVMASPTVRHMDGGTDVNDLLK
ncbi:MAG: hypothetical protein HYT09_02825 [Candidatus Levybacteria bacterium]|nr:hypothetical protein [Candidatus Levybacteria bacterium]